MNGVLSCFICHDSDSTLRFFHVPKSPTRLQEWSQLLKGVEVKSSSLVCEKHFLEEHLTKNLELNCWQLNSTAIPMLQLTPKEFDGLNLISEAAFDINCNTNINEGFMRRLKTNATQTEYEDAYECGILTVTHNFMAYTVNCFYCDACFSIQNWQEFVSHINSQHRYKFEAHFEAAAQENVNEELQVYADMQRIDGNYEDETETKTVQFPKRCQKLNEDLESEVVSSFDIEDSIISNDLVTNSNSTVEEANMDELFKTKVHQPEWDVVNNMLPNGEEGTKQLNMATSDASLVFYIIDLLQSYPTLWFINGTKSKQYEAGLTNLYRKFTEKYEFLMTQTELHESLIEIRDWYQKIFEKNISDKLTFPLSEYYNKLAEFLPDDLNGKTCQLCARLFQDHVQYFAHQKLEHAKPLSADDDNEQTDEVSLVFLKEHVNDYFAARYPRYQAGISYKCQICTKKYELKCYFVEHIKTHLDICDYICDLCGKTFLRQENYLLHQKKHGSLHKTQCHICGTEFTNFSHLTAHRKHYHRSIESTNGQIELPQRTQRQYKASSRYIPYREGNNIHFACPFCDKTYKYKSGAQKHYNQFHRTEALEAEIFNARKSNNQNCYENKKEVNYY